MTKLLNKPLKAFTLYSLLILLCSIPVYFIVVESIWIEELDEHNLNTKNRIEKQFHNLKIKTDSLTEIIQLWNILQPSMPLNRIDESQVMPDSTYTQTKQNTHLGETGTERYRILYSNIKINNQNYQISIETNVEEVDETLMAIAIVTFGFFGLLILGFIFLNKSISKKIWKPFDSTLQQLKTFDINKNQHLKFSISDIEEFQELNNELSKLIDRSIQSFNSQKTFIENASHELQTPIAVLKSKIEMLRQSDDLGETLSNRLDALNNPLSRIIRINKNLLLLAKIENHQFGNNSEIYLIEIIEDNISLLQDYLEDKEISIQINKTHDIKISCNKILIEILLNNLIVNAINNSKKNECIQIEIENNKLKISNPGNSALSKDKLYQRFVNMGNESTSTGLGLSIIKEICNRYNWSIEYSFNNTLHIFTIEF